MLVTMSKLEDGGAAGLKMFAGLGEGLGRLHSVGAVRPLTQANVALLI